MKITTQTELRRLVADAYTDDDDYLAAARHIEAWSITAYGLPDMSGGDRDGYDAMTN